MLHRRIREFGTAERPGVNDLLAVGVNDLEVLTGLNGHSLTFPRWDGDADVDDIDNP
jgi:hypothetical protein